MKFDMDWLVVTLRYCLFAVMLFSVLFLGFLVGSLEIPPYQQFQSILSNIPLSLVSRGDNPGSHDDPPPGNWNRVETEKTESSDDALKGLGYLSGSEKPDGRNGVIYHHSDSTARGVNLYVSGHGPEAILMDNSGTVLHRWRLPFEKAFPDRLVSSDVTGERGRVYWRKFHLYPNGDLLAIFGNHGIIKVDRDSNLIWKQYNRAHHDVWVADNGNIYVLTREQTRIEERDGTIVEDYISKLSPDGNPVARYSLLEAVRQSPYRSLLDYIPAEQKDLLHTNTLEILSGDEADQVPAFTEGNALVSFNPMNTVAVVDLPANEIVWTLSGMSTRQHDPQLLSSGHILFLDNRGHNGYSKVVEVDPVTREVEWAFHGNQSNDFYTESKGTVQRLDNGNTLINESDEGRVFEVTPSKEVVWDFRNPQRAGNNNQYVASVFDMKRYSRDYVNNWLKIDSD